MNQAEKVLQAATGEADKLSRVAKLLGVDLAAMEALKPALEKVLAADAESWTAVQERITAAVGDYRTFKAIVISIGEGKVTVERKAATSGGTGGKGGYAGNGKSFGGHPLTVPPEMVKAHSLPTGEYKSRRALAHALAESYGVAKREADGNWLVPADNRTATFIRETAADIWEAIGKPQD